MRRLEVNLSFHAARFAACELRVSFERGRESMSANGFLDKLSKFFNPGYRVTFGVNDVDKSVLDKIIDILKADHFILVQEIAHPARRNYLLAAYLKSFTSERNNCINATCHYPKSEYPEKRLESLGLVLQNDVRGREPAMKSKMDALADSLFDEISKHVSKENIFVTRRNTSPQSGA